MTPNISPSLMVRVKSSTAVIVFLLDVKCLRKPSIEINSTPPKKCKKRLSAREQKDVYYHQSSRSLICQSYCFAGIGTFHKINEGCRGFIAPAPHPLTIRYSQCELYSKNYKVN